jgi:glycine cleavage system H protein
MAEYLETTFEKFIFRVKVGYLYSNEDFWVDIRGTIAKVGLTDFLQKSKGDVAFLETVEPGTLVKIGQELGKIETIKATLGIVSPVAGNVVEVNRELEGSPHLINSDPYGAGWICKIELIGAEGDRKALLQAESYMELMKQKIEREAKKLYG